MWQDVCIYQQKRSSQAEEICEELRIRAAVVEEIFFPAVKSVRDKQAKFDVEEALQEHKQINAAMHDILKIQGQVYRSMPSKRLMAWPHRRSVEAATGRANIGLASEIERSVLKKLLPVVMSHPPAKP